MILKSVEFLQWVLRVFNLSRCGSQQNRYCSQQLESEKLLHLLPGNTTGEVWALLQHAVQANWCISSVPVGAAKTKIEEQVEAGCQLLKQVDMATAEVREEVGEGGGGGGGRGGERQGVQHARMHTGMSSCMCSGSNCSAVAFVTMMRVDTCGHTLEVVAKQQEAGSDMCMHEYQV